MNKQRLMHQHEQARTAMHWHSTTHDKVRCTLCPRQCQLKPMKMGACGVRGHVDHQLKTFNFGFGLAATEEVIETEAVNHYQPGARILSLGNVGCMMNCSFCQNWETSQVKHLNMSATRRYSPQAIVDLCLANQIDIISWTYNDPVVWHEFVLETSRLAQTAGLKTLYKSAFYIEAEPVDELIECIDIFSLSLKSMSERFYRRVTKSRLQPVLDRIKQVAQSDRHLEISQLLIPELNDQEEDIARTIDWVLSEIGPEVPLHFVAFHPAYRYTHVERTSTALLIRARELAQAAGLRYVYLGNVNEEQLNDSECENCGATLVKRFGLSTRIAHLDDHGHCEQCGHASVIRMSPVADTEVVHAPRPTVELSHLRYTWPDDIQSVHLVRRDSKACDWLEIKGIGSARLQTRQLGRDLDRFIISRFDARERGIEIRWPREHAFEVLPILDRAHYPVAAQAMNVRLPEPATATIEVSPALT